MRLYTEILDLNKIEQQTGIFTTNKKGISEEYHERNKKFKDFIKDKVGEYELAYLGIYDESDKVTLKNGTIINRGDKVYTVVRIFIDKDYDLIEIGNVLIEDKTNELSQVHKDKNGNLINVKYDNNNNKRVSEELLSDLSYFRLKNLKIRI